LTPDGRGLGNRPVTPVSPVEFSSTGAGFLFRPMPLPPPPRERQPFSRHRTPSASKQPSSGPSVSPRVATGLVLSTSLHSRPPFFAGLPPRARSPWSSPAATGKACLDLTPLPDFCNHTKGRAHWTNVRTSLEAPFLALPAPSPRRDPGFLSGGVNPAPEGAGPAGRSRPSQHARGGSRGQLELLRAPLCR
jgi:hypothetical protein